MLYCSYFLGENLCLNVDVPFAVSYLTMILCPADFVDIGTKSCPISHPTTKKTWTANNKVVFRKKMNVKTNNLHRVGFSQEANFFLKNSKFKAGKLYPHNI